MINILKEIIQNKSREIEYSKSIFSQNELIKRIENIDDERGFRSSIEKNYNKNKTSVIAEIKKASPSKGIIKENFNPSLIAKAYESGNATCLSVLTDKKFFHGSIEDLQIVKQSTKLPILRKDFIISEYQIFESKAFGADCILLLHSILNVEEIKKYIDIAKNLGLDTFIEVHNKNELLNVIDFYDVLIGINNRNLSDMSVDLNNAINLKKEVAINKNIVCESGISSIQQIKYLLQQDFKTFLIGEFLMKSQNPKKVLLEINKL